MPVSSAQLEAVLLKAAAELRAAEAAANETAGCADEQLPDFEAEDGLNEAAAAGSAAESASQGADDASSAAKAAAAAGVAGEEGAEELLQELQEQQQQQPAALGPRCDMSAMDAASQAPAPLPPVHPRLTFYTLSSR